ncbi:autophagy protein atg9 [Thecaphora frezii]
MDPFGDPDQEQHAASSAVEWTQKPPVPNTGAGVSGPSTAYKLDSPFDDDAANDALAAPTIEAPDPLGASELASGRAHAANGPDGFDEPPASVMLDIDGDSATPRATSGAGRRSPASAPPSSRGRRIKASIFEQSRIPDDPEPAGRSTADGYGDDGDEDLYADEEAALMARSSRERGYPEASTSRNKDKSRSHWTASDGDGDNNDRSGSQHRHRRRDAVVSSTSSRSERSGRRRGRRRGWDWASALPSTTPRSRRMALGGLDPKQKALWMWANVDNLDAFLQEVYAYYLGKGVVCIALSRGLNLLTIAFVIGFSTFLLGCVDYSSIRHDGQLSEVIVGHCVSRFSNLSLLLMISFSAFYGWQVVQFGLGLSRLAAMHRFYTHLLNIPDADVQSIPWNEVVNRLAALREEHPITSLSSEVGGGAANPAKDKLDAHDVANRIMRQENYLIALFNKDTLDLTVPGLRHRSPALTRSLEWNLNFCLLGFLFDSQGQVRRQFLTDRHRGQLIDGLRRRFLFMAIVNAVFAPFIVLYLLVYSFFRYFEEYHKDPSNLGSRQYTQYARWKFREFNELPHLFRRRCHSSYPYAQRYIDQFPKEKTAVVARFVAFIAGSFTAVLLLASVIDPDLFLHFDITPQRNVLFYIGVFGTVLAVSRGMIPDEHLVFEPEVLLRAVIHHTHYMPEHWKGRFHSTDVHVEFGQLYTLKIYVFLQELLSVITTPFVLWLSLPRCAPEIIDFFREFTVHVDGIGYVCSFAVFNFRREGNAAAGGGDGPAAVDDERMPGAAGAGPRQAKMEQSILGFKANHPDWEPTDPASSLFLSRMAAAATDAEGDLAPPARFRGEGGVVSAGGSLDPRQLEYPGEAEGKPFTPVNSTLLATRSQFYENAFTRSIALARDKDNAAALAASAHRGRNAAAKGPAGHNHHSRSKGRSRMVNDGSFSQRIIEEDEGETEVAERAFSTDLLSPGRSQTGVGTAAGGGSGDAMEQSHFEAAGNAGVRDLLHHIYTGRGTPGGPRW